MGELFENFKGYDVPAVRREARAEGRTEGRTEGETICVIKQVCKKLDKAKTMEQMADELEENMETIAKICSAIEKEGTHDAEAIFHFMNPE